MKLAPGKHTIRFERRNSLEWDSLGKRTGDRPETAPDKLVVASSAVQIEILASSEPLAAIPVRWGTPRRGRRHPSPIRSLGMGRRRAADLQRERAQPGAAQLYVAQAQELGELEVDGIWYRWAGDIEVKSSVFPPGRQYDDIRVTLASDWRPRQGQPLQVMPGRHIVRFAANMEPRESAGKAASLRAVSNPVEVIVQPAIGTPAALVKKYMPG